MKNKRIIALLVVALMVVALFAGCQPKPTPQTQPQTQAKTDPPKTDPPKTDAPKTDAPKTDAAKTDAGQKPAGTTVDPNRTRIPIGDPNKIDFPPTKIARKDKGTEYPNIDKTTVDTLTVYKRGKEYGPLKDYWFVDYMKENFGIQLDLIADEKGKVDAMIAGHTLPDISVLTLDEAKNAALAGLLMPFDDVLDKMPNVAKVGANALNFHRDNLGVNDGKAYGIGSNIVTDVAKYGLTNQSTYLRYDLYLKAGAPHIKTLMDYIPVLEKMHELNPTNEEGQQVFAVSDFSTWDNMFAGPGNLCQSFGAGVIGNGMLVMPKENNKLVPFIDSNSKVVEALRFYNKLNQKGLMDPDSFTQTYNDWRKKNATGRTLFNRLSWGHLIERPAQGIGYRGVYSDDVQVIVNGLNPVGNLNGIITISKSTQHIDKVCTYIDMQYDPYYVIELYNGPYGVCWEVGDDGKPYITDLGDDIMNAKKGEFQSGGELPGGGVVSDAYKGVMYGLWQDNIHPDYGVPLRYINWVRTPYQRLQHAPLTLKWEENYKADNILQYLSDHDQLVPLPFAPLPKLPDEIIEVAKRVNEATKPITWNMLAAGSDAEFDELLKQLQDTAMDLEYQKVIDWYSENYPKALEMAKKYGG